MRRDVDYLSQIAAYIKKNLKKGYTKESLKWALVKQRYSKSEIEKAFKKADEELSKEAPVLKVRPEIKYEIVEPKDITYKKVEKRSFFGRLFKRS